MNGPHAHCVHCPPRGRAQRPSGGRAGTAEATLLNGHVPGKKRRVSDGMVRGRDVRAYFAGMRRGFAAGFGLAFGAVLAVAVDARLTFGAAAGLAAGDLRTLAAAA